MATFAPDILDHKGFRRFLGYLQTIGAIDKVVLFGSRARGDNAERSDIDIAVSAPTASRDDWYEIFRLANDAPTLLDIDVTNLDTASPALAQQIVAEGITLYARRGATEAGGPEPRD